MPPTALVPMRDCCKHDPDLMARPRWEWIADARSTGVRTIFPTVLGDGNEVQLRAGPLDCNRVISCLACRSSASMTRSTSSVSVAQSDTEMRIRRSPR